MAPGAVRRLGLLGQTSDGQEVRLRSEDRTAHVALIGKSRFGKTTLLEHLVVDDFTSGTGVIVLDAHGDLTDRLVALAPASLHDRLAVVELDTSIPFGLNLYECPTKDSLDVDRVVGNVVEVFKKLFLDERSFYPVIEDGLRNSAYVIIANGWTLAEVPLLFTESAFLRKALVEVTNRTVRQFWEQYLALPAREQRERSDPVLNKVNRFLASDAIRLMVSQARTTIPFTSALAQGGTLIFRLSGDRLDRETSAFLGMVFLASLSNAVAQRAGEARAARQRVHVYLDEYGRFATRTTDRMLEEFGKYEIGLTVAHQNLEQLGGKPASAASLVMFQLDGQDAPTMAMHLDTTPRRTKTVVKPRTEPQYSEEKLDRWESDTVKAEYEQLVKSSREMRKDSMYLASRVPHFEQLVLRNDHKYNPACWSERVCSCVQHGDIGGDFSGQYPPPKDALAAFYAMNRLFNPAHFYFSVILKDREREGGRLTASGLVGLYDVKEAPQPGSGGSQAVTRCERYYLRPDAAEYSNFAIKLDGYLRTYEGRCSRDWLVPFGNEILEKLRELYKTTPFHLRAAPEVPRLGAERPGEQWVRGHWVTELFPSMVEEMQTTWTARRRRKEEVNREIPRREKRAKELYETKRTTEIVKTYRGHKQVDDGGTRTVNRTAYRFGKAVDESYAVPDAETWYDEIEELDQTHSDRAAEIATELASLPKYVAYCKLLDSGGNPHEYRVNARPPAVASGTLTTHEIGQRSRLMYGMHAFDVEKRVDARRNIGGGGESEPPTIGRRSPR